MKERAAIYVRVSTEEQKRHGISVDSQLAALHAYCEEKGLEVAGVYNDAGLSARKSYLKRPELLRLLEDCKARKIDIILFTKLDRWFRSVSDYYEVQRTLEACKVPWRAIWEDYETVTSTGVFKVNIMLSVAQSEADRTSERIKAVNNYRRERGDYIGQAPLGYKREKNVLVFDEATHDGVDAFFRGYLDYLPLKECAAAAAEHGVIIRRNNAYRILASRTYVGDAHGSKCPAYITEEEYQKILARRTSFVRRPASLDQEYIFQGLCRCMYCGRMMTGSSRRRYSHIRGDYVQHTYQCRNTVSNYFDKPCQGCGINEEILEAIVLDKLEETLADFAAKVSIADKTAAEEEYNRKKDALDARIRRIAEMYEDGLISRDEYKAKKDAAIYEMTTLPKPQQEHGIPELPENWREVYDGLTKENKRLFWRRTLRCIKVGRGHIVELVF